MTKRGRPRHPERLTPREQEVLALLREGLTNPQIAERLGIGVEGAKYHVSEILSKLHVSTREEAAAWRDDAIPWWAGVVAFWRPPLRAASIAVAGGVLAVAAIGLVLIGVLLARGGDGEEANTDPSVAQAPSETALPSAAPTPTPLPPTLDQTPDLSSVLLPEDAWLQLSQIPSIRNVLDAVSQGDVSAFSDLVAWTDQRCGTRATQECPPGIERHTELPMLNVADSVASWVTRDNLEVMLDEILNGQTLQMNFASWREDEVAGHRLLGIGLEGTPQPASHWGSLTPITGLFILLDPEAEDPVLSISSLTPEWSAVEQGGNNSNGYAGQEIVAFSVPTPTAG